MQANDAISVYNSYSCDDYSPKIQNFRRLKMADEGSLVVCIYLNKNKKKNFDIFSYFSVFNERPAMSTVDFNVYSTIDFK